MAYVIWPRPEHKSLEKKDWQSLVSIYVTKAQNHRGEPCRQGWTAARTGCTPRQRTGGTPRQPAQQSRTPRQSTPAAPNHQASAEQAKTALSNKDNAILTKISQKLSSEKGKRGGDYGVKGLKVLAKALGVKAGSLKKDQLIDALLQKLQPQKEQKEQKEQTNILETLEKLREQEQTQQLEQQAREQRRAGEQRLREFGFGDDDFATMSDRDVQQNVRIREGHEPPEPEANRDINSSRAKPEVLKEFFPNLTPEQAIKKLPDFAGAVGNARVEISTRFGAISIKMRGYGENNDYVMNRTFTKEGNHLYCHNDYFKNRNEGGSGLGLKSFSKEVDNLTKLGFAYIETFAAKGGDYVGYKVWPKFGYDGPLQTHHHLGLKAGLKTEYARFKNVKTIQELYAMPGGREAWEKHGSAIDLKFDLTPNSLSNRILNAYKERKKNERAA